jgi:DNA-binding beta-propeller fold protein YncE
MKQLRKVFIATALCSLLAALGGAQRMIEKTTVAQSKAAVEAPVFQVDPMWPKPLPNHWIIGSTIGVSADAQDHIWIIHRPDTLVANETGLVNNPPTASCCAPAPPVLEFDQAGNLIGHWGGKGEGYEWPQSNHGITVDYKGNVWIGGNGQKDAEVLKFTQEGKFLLQIGHFDKSKGSLDTENLHRAAKIYVDPGANEAYVSDGYGNHRVIVFDADTGAFKRMWGAYGNKPEDTDFGRYNPNAPPLQQFRNPVHCAEIANDGLVYVCDRTNDRIQVFHKDGTFVKEAFVQKTTLGSGSVWDIAFSKDPRQKYVYVADGSDEKVFILLRDTLDVVTSFGDGGRWPGTFFGVHSIATDSKGNIYTTETYEGKRVQRFLYKGLGPVPAAGR